MKHISLIVLIYSSILIGCNVNNESTYFTTQEKESIQNLIQKEINVLIEAVNNKDIVTYMEKMPSDFIIYDENGETISRAKQKEYALRDWSIIKKTLNNQMIIDSIEFIAKDSLYVFTFQKWERIMFQRDGITTDTVLTTQKHKELWKKRSLGWIGYDVKELGGDIFINGEVYKE